MKKTLLFSIGMILGIFSSGQSLSPTAVTSGGGYQQSTNASLSYTIGEIATETYTGKRAILTQGFQQLNLIVTSLSDLLPELQLQIFPNPTASWLSVVLPESGSGLSFLLFDAQGKLLSELNKMIPGSTVRVDLNGYPAGTYFLRALTADRTIGKTYKITKVRY